MLSGQMEKNVLVTLTRALYAIATTTDDTTAHTLRDCADDIRTVIDGLDLVMRGTHTYCSVCGKTVADDESVALFGDHNWRAHEQCAKREEAEAMQGDLTE